MSISDIDMMKKRFLKTAFIYLSVSVLCILFGTVYEYFSHEIYSVFMVYAFIFPLCGGTLPFVFLAFYRKKKFPGRFSFNLYNSGIATLTVGSIMQGILEIYGTTNDILTVFWIVGIGFSAIGLLIYIVSN